MNKIISSSIIGELSRDEKFPNIWRSDRVTIPFYDNKDLIVTFLGFNPEIDLSFIEETDQALKNFLGLTIENRYEISSLVYQECMDYIDSVKTDSICEQIRRIEDKNQIWNFIHPIEICVRRRSTRDKKIYIAVFCNCDWELEHGLQLVFRNGDELIRISNIDGHLTDSDAYNSDLQDEILFKFS